MKGMIAMPAQKESGLSNNLSHPNAWGATFVRII